MLMIRTKCQRVAKLIPITHGRGMIFAVLAQSQEISNTMTFTLQFLTAFSLFRTACAANYDKTHGNSLCPCLTSETIGRIKQKDLTEHIVSKFPSSYNISEYGIGCFPHDMKTINCEQCSNKRSDCEIAKYCTLHFCYINPNSCELTNSRSVFFPNSQRYYSYATCNDIDSFTSDEKIKSLNGQTFRVGLNSNSGGWQGSYSSEGKQYIGSVNSWSGPTFEFAVEGALRGGYKMNFVEPPHFLNNRSKEFFNSSSSFDLCIFATSLGYLDFCLAQYSISYKRAISTDWLVLGSQDLYLIIQLQGISSDFEYFLMHLQTIFKPFTPGVWFLIIALVIPSFAWFMLYHEYGYPGSAFPAYQDIFSSKDTSGVKIGELHFSLHLLKSMYMTVLAVFQQGYGHSVMTVGAKLNLLGLSFFVLTILAVYTANLAAVSKNESMSIPFPNSNTYLLTPKILGQAASLRSVSNLEDAIKANYRFCSERKNLEAVRAQYPKIHDINLVVDPRHLGGDGAPGFNCATCSSRVRVFDFLDVKMAALNKQYCHAAFAPMEDLEIEQKGGRHCDKSRTGRKLASIQTGIPVTERRSSALIAFFLMLKNNAVFDRALRKNQPKLVCPLSKEKSDQGIALNLSKLTGIWIVSFSFAIAGLIATLLRWKSERLRNC
jgi:hypothetical protein